ncbi:tetratricopeptide repeat protein 37-like [Ptychodera flava]|uniref:tetratricopeptide repeat protein 37-like n=1 Tax=Ptychodera flava TaxID=63121 RepID=UPI00396AAEC0
MASGKSKEIKTFMKNAKEAIKNKDYKEVMKNCKAVLKQDKTNYNALVFFGVAAAELDQPDQARMAYKKAIDTDPKQILAWQGLSGFYEKRDNPEYKTELADAYSKMMAIYEESDMNKWKETAKKLAQLYKQMNNDLQAVEIWLIVGNNSSLEDRDRLDAWKGIATILSSLKTIPSEYSEQFEKSLQIIVDTAEINDETQKWYQRYIKLLFDKYAFAENAEKFETECKKMAANYPTASVPLEMLCKFYMQRLQDADSQNAIEAYTQLNERDPSSSMAQCSLGYSKLIKKDYLLARDQLQNGMKTNQNFLCGWYYLCQSQYHLCDYDGVITSANKGLKLLKNENEMPVENQKKLNHEFNSMFCVSLVNTRLPNNINKAIEIYQKLLEADETRLDVIIGLGKTYLAINEMDKAREYCEKAVAIDNKDHAVIAMQGWLEYMQDNLKEAQDRMLEAIESNKNIGLYYHQLGRIYWKMGQDERRNKTKCFNNFLKAAKLEPYHSDSFLYLGYYYQEIAADINKAKKCYQKTFDLDSRNDEAGAALGDALIALDEEESALTLYNSVTSKASAGTAKWAWLRLGLYQLKHREYSQSVASFQHALRADPKDRCCWECLAEAYINRGSYTAALKAFTKATELDPNSIYCHFQIAAIKQTLGLLAEAVTEYKVILSNSADYVPALKGIGETLISLARSARAEFFNGRVVDYVGEAIRYLSKAVRHRPDVSCLWKLLGDACTIIHSLDKQLIRIDVPRSLLDRGLKEEELVAMEKMEILSLGAKCYGRALCLKPEVSSLWHDLGVNYFRQSQEMNCEETVRTEFAKKAMQCLQKAVSMDTNNHVHWNALGLMAASKAINNPKLAQHAFIKSIQAESNNVVAWTNLGALYYSHHQIELAHNAFKVAQSLEPSYVACWIGQALVAETIGSEEAMDLFRHTTELATHLEGSVGYASWVCNTIFSEKIDKKSELYKYNIVEMGAVTSAAVSIGKYTDRKQDDPTASNIHGLLLEQEKLYNQAEKMFARTVRLLKQNGDKSQLNMALSNYARILCATGKCKESVELYQSISPLSDFNDVCGLALALCKANQLKESYQAFEQALQLASSNEEKSRVLASMGVIAYHFQDMERAKTLLFKCSQVSPPCTEGILALCSLAFLQSDFKLASAALGELLKLGDSEKYAEDICFLTSCLYALQGSYNMAKNQILKAIRKCPWRAKLWQQAAKFIIQYIPSKAESAATCSKVANKQDFRVSKNSATFALSQLAAGQYRKKDKNSNALKTAQKMVHLYPNETSHHVLLSASCYADEVRAKAMKQNTHFGNNLNTKLAQFVVQQGETMASEGANQAQRQQLIQWATKQTIESLLLSQDYSKTKDFIQSIKQVYKSQAQFTSQLEMLNAKTVFLEMTNGNELELLRNAVLKEAASSEAWQTLAEVYYSQGMMVAAETCYRQSLQVSKSAKIVPLVRLAYLALMLSVPGDATDKWTALCQQATTEALKLDPQCIAGLLIQGILHFGKNQRAAKRNLQYVASHGTDYSGSIARFYLMKIYLEKNDTDAIQLLLTDAEKCADPNQEILIQLATSVAQ